MSRDVILVIDSDREAADNIAWNLLPVLGYEALVAYDGKTATEILSRQSQVVSLIIIDSKLSDRGGLDLINQLHDDGYHIPSIVMSSRWTRRVTVDSFRWGVQAYLTKPINIEDLSAVISPALSETKIRREMKTLTTRLKEKEERLSALLKFSKRITSAPDVESVLQNIVESCVNLTNADSGFLALVNQQQNQLDLKTATLYSEDDAGSFSLDLDNPWVSKTLIAGYPIRISQSKGEVPYFYIGIGPDWHNILLAPLFAKGKPLGILGVGTENAETEFSDDDKSLIATLADYAAITLENSDLKQKAQDEIAERERLQVVLEESENKLKSAIPGVRDGSWNWDLRTNRVFYSPNWKSIIGCEDEDIGDSPEDWFKRVHPDDIAQVKMDIALHIEQQKPQFINEHRLVNKNGDYIWVLGQGLAERDENGNVYLISGMLYDIAELKKVEDELYHDAFTNLVTCLPNRAAFTDRLNHTLTRSKLGAGFEFGLLYVDLDNFRQVSIDCDTQVGDDVILQVARLLVDGLQPGNTVAHFGEDDFAILIEHIENVESLTAIAEWILKQFYQPFHVIDFEVLTSASVGIVMSAAYHHAEEMLRDAEIAMYAAKEDGGAQYKEFDASMRAKVVRSLSLENDVKTALEKNEFVLYYLPTVVLDNGALAGFDAVVRWQHPRHGILNPVDYIASVANAEMTAEIDRWALREACAQIRKWQLQFNIPAIVSVSVNISKEHIANPDIFDTIMQTIQETGLEAENLKIEIPEDALIDNDPDYADFYNKLAGLGVKIQVKDFQIEYVRLGDLTKYPIGALKIAPAYIQKMTEIGSHLEFLQGILTLARKIKAVSIAEGVENDEQFAILREFDCDYGQGDYISDLLDIESTETMLMEMKKKGNFKIQALT